MSTSSSLSSACGSSGLFRSLHRSRAFLDLLLVFGGQGLGREVNGELRQRASELERHLRRVVFNHRRAGVLPHVEGLVEREPETNRALDVTLGHLSPVHQQRAGPTLTDTTTVILKV